ncbi:MAG: 1-deoxy-D-xylulose-5-phosphate reductoisomerase [Bacilli bacterium]|nr:1-deoxy-D-xylulose-5-phosphate reductoisomerase [Bacilli bacterium]
MKRILLLGCTGSIGLQTIALVKDSLKDFHIVYVSLFSNIDILEKSLKDLPYLEKVGIQDPSKAQVFAKRHPEYEVVLSNDDVNVTLASDPKYDKAVNAITGAAGFSVSMKVLEMDKDLCLANKESLVIGGEVIKKQLKISGRLFPIDSEHVALAKLFQNARRDEIEKVIITASGGSLRDVPFDRYKDVTLQQVLNHPTWKMGTRITVDSATMVNKGFEFIEARYLYDWPIDRIEPLINDESKIHSALKFKDNSYLFEVGPSDMKIPISYALNENKRVSANYKDINFDCQCSLNFRKFQREKYPLFDLVLDTYKLGGTAMAFLNAVDEEAIARFARHQITFLQMIEYIQTTVKNELVTFKVVDKETIKITDHMARKIVASELD